MMQKNILKLIKDSFIKIIVIIILAMSLLVILFQLL